MVTAARLYDGKADSLQKPGRIVVDGDKIIAVGPGKAPADAELIDLGDATLLPGLMDAHSHLTFEASEDWKQDELDAFKKSIPEQTIDATVFAKRTIEAGFTSVRDLGSSDLIDVGLRNGIAAGKTPGPRMYVAVHAISARGGHCDPTAGYRPGLLKEPDITDGVADGADQMRAAVRFYVKHGQSLRIGWRAIARGQGRLSAAHAGRARCTGRRSTCTR